MTTTRDKTLLIADLHLDASAPAIAGQFLAFLATDARQARALYILGDLFEAWLGDDDPEPAGRAIVAALRGLTDSGVPVYFIHGNRDFLVGPRFAAESGCTLLADGTIVDLHGERVLLMHGDVLCTADTSYQRLRRILRNPLVSFIVRHLPLAARRRLGRKLRAGSRMHVGATAAEIMDVTPAAVAATMRAAQVRTLVHGHTHRPAIHEFELDGAPARRIVLGDWYTQGSVLEWRDDGVELRALARASDQGTESGV
ncbi:MAG TPA: UDP-2,3-diacylglucosamine diphosphatase [Steroidobacteraceae bacterium]|nr:UDP-2,3-diacylglucosamine diphosphatase [Steroidobacteraceae bacterium]